MAKLTLLDPTKTGMPAQELVASTIRVLPEPVGPRKRKFPIGRPAGDKPARMGRHLAAKKLDVLASPNESPLQFSLARKQQTSFAKRLTNCLQYTDGFRSFATSSSSASEKPLKDSNQVFSLGKDTPYGRVVETKPSAQATLISSPRLGGLHHRYHWQEAA